MQKEFNQFEKVTIKRTAMNVNPLVSKRLKLQKKVLELQAEIDVLQKTQDQFEEPIKTMTGGYNTEDLVEKVIKTTEKLDNKGNPIKTTTYVFKYPETITPNEIVSQETEFINLEDTEESSTHHCTEEGCSFN